MWSSSLGFHTKPSTTRAGHLDTVQPTASNPPKRVVCANPAPRPFRLFAASCCGLLLTVMFAGLFGWSFWSWRDEIDAHNEDLALEKVCTKLQLTQNVTGPIVFVDNIEYISFNHKEKLGSCLSYLLKQGMGYYYERDEETSLSPLYATLESVQIDGSSRRRRRD